MICRRKLIARLAGATAVAAAALLAAPTAHAQKAADETLASLKVPEGMEITLWAAEPALVNPTNMDIDSRGRVWVLEGANYRRFNTRPEGDRIVILEDTDGDGKADSQKVFWQDKSLQSPLGIAVLGNRVIVSQSPNVLEFEIDESGDKPKGPPKVILTGFGGVNHDHGVHAGVFGPDGRYYFNAGNDGMNGHVKYADGTPVVDSLGSELGSKATKFRGGEKPKGRIGYTDGHAFRCDPDFKNFETLGFNFRNNYELTVDSFGTVWQSDNDDDGNQSVRINFVMEGGNFGFKSPKGAPWGKDKDAYPGQSKQEQHWHLRWPGTVPNLLNTGGGSPTGITVYEGALLPEQFRGALIHCDAGPNVVRAYITSPSSSAPVGLMTTGKALDGATDQGAGYKAVPIELVKGEDKWFRPSDVTVAPDGSIFIADWYDPGVGGHNMQDKKEGEKNPTDWQNLRGRIYRLAPKGHKPTKVAVDLNTTAGQIAALNNPNFAVRYLAWQKLNAGGAEAAKALEAQFKTDANPRMRARALWLLARSTDGKKHVESALKDNDENIRITAFRAARMLKMDIPAIGATLAADASAGVRREVAVAMNYEPAEKAVPVLVALAEKYDGQDRWYLEAIGIGATGKEDAFLAAWDKSPKKADAKATELLTWRMKKIDPTEKTAANPAPIGPKASIEGSNRPFDSGGRQSVSPTAAVSKHEVGKMKDEANARRRVAAASAFVLHPSSFILVLADGAGPGIPADAPPLKDKAGEVLPSIDDLAKLTGDAKRGAAIYRNAKGVNCISCHQVADEGTDVGPPLTTIGEKLSKAQLYEAVLYPSAGILMGYEQWSVKTKEDDVITGMLAAETEEELTIKDATGKYIDLKKEKVARKTQLKVSLMPEGLQTALTKQELLDLVEYLTTLRNP
jgi:putative membrane-bound dehydrogenase-like protein